MVEVIDSFGDLCRLCAGKIDMLLAFNVFAADQRELLKKINTCLPIEVSPTDNFPKTVCMECTCKLDLMFEFRERCLLTAHLFEEMISSEDVRTVLVLPEQDHNEGTVLMGNDVFPSCEKLPCKIEEKPLQIISFSETLPEDKPITLENIQLCDAIVKEESTAIQHTTLVDDCQKHVLSEDRSEKQELLPKSNSKVKVKCVKGERKVCSECGKVCSTNYKLQEHMRRHTGEKPYKCSNEECKKLFRSKIGLAQHEASHSGKFEYACTTCGKGFQCKSYLVVHQRVHSDYKPYPCQHCTMSFKTKQSLLDHINRHLGVKPFLCDICGRGFITKGLCKSHQKVHSGTDNRQYPCHVCRKLFVSKSYLNTHLRIHTGEKPFMCEVCGKGFLTRVDLRIHSTMHTGEKKFVCETCGKAFARRDALRCHRRSHTGERPYKCDYCGQSFTQFSPMAIHKRLHTGERPYKCDICAKTFVSRSTMLAHKKKNHDSKELKVESPQISESCITNHQNSKDAITPKEVIGYAGTTINVDLLDVDAESPQFDTAPTMNDAKPVTVRRSRAIVAPD